MDLNVAVDTLSWRRISSLIAGLSGESRWANVVQSTAKVSGRAADQYLLSLVTKE